MVKIIYTEGKRLEYAVIDGKLHWRVGIMWHTMSTRNIRAVTDSFPQLLYNLEDEVL